MPIDLRFGQRQHLDLFFLLLCFIIIFFEYFTDNDETMGVPLTVSFAWPIFIYLPVSTSGSRSNSSFPPSLQGLSSFKKITWSPESNRHINDYSNSNAIHSILITAFKWLGHITTHLPKCNCFAFHFPSPRVHPP